MKNLENYCYKLMKTTSMNQFCPPLICLWEMAQMTEVLSL